MIELSLSELNRSSFYENTLQMIEQICDDYARKDDFGTLSMANQMVCDFLENTYPDFTADVVFQIESDGVTFQYTLQSGGFQYTLQSGGFQSLAENKDGQNTALYVLQSLADEITFSSDYDTLVSTFHVKTNMNIQRSLHHQEVRTRIFS